MTHTRILGLSLGTRTVGMALICNGELIDWYVKAFRQQWSEQKKEVILDTIDRMLERCTATAFAIKIPAAAERHHKVRELYTAINLLAQSKHIATETYSIEDLKALCGNSVRNKQGLRTKVLSLFPELQFEFDKELTNRNKYYTKLFEAALAGHALYTGNAPILSNIE